MKKFFLDKKDIANFKTLILLSFTLLCFFNLVDAVIESMLIGYFNED